MKTKLLFYLILLFGLNSYSQIINVASGLNLPTPIFIDGNDLYVAELNADKITKFDATLTNQTLGTTLATGTNIPNAFARYGNYLYIAKNIDNSHDKIVRIDLSIPNSLPSDFLTVYPNVNGINQSFNIGTLLVIGNYMFITDAILGGVLKVDLTQNNPVPSIVVTGISTPYGLASKGNDLYISQWDNGNISNNYSSIYKIDISQPNPTLSTVISGLGNITSLVVKCNYLFLNEASDTSISYINLTQLNPTKTTLLSSLISLSLAIKGDYLYFDQYGYNEISKIDVSPVVNVVPTFSPIAPVCSGTTLSPLPTTSNNINNNITGTWSPAFNGSATTTYTFTPNAGQCATTTTMVILIDSPITPTFTPIANVCTLTTVSPLSTTSLEGITGTWSPAFNNTTTPFNLTTTVYTFTPDAGQCATMTTISVTVYPLQDIFFIPIDPICAGETLVPPPNTSLNGVTGSWSPAFNNTVTTTYTFTPDAGYCAVPRTLTITVNPVTTPTFNQIAPLCSGTPLLPLPTTSTNVIGITGTWSPNTFNNTTTTFTFTPNAGQCATTTTMTIVVNPVITPTFASIAPICSGTTVSPLPTTSNNNPTITGTWSPVFNGSATTTYTFTPTSNLCATTTAMTIAVTPATTWYLDNDSDTYGNPSISIFACSRPTGYVSNNTDCNDSNAAVNPNHVEVPGNGIDDNCDGIIDEVFPTVRLIPQQCGSTLTSLWDSLFSTQAPSPLVATSYRFEISNFAPPYLQTFDTFSPPLYRCSISNFTGLLPGTTYTVRVAIKVNGFWRAYGPPCTITTPAGIATSLVPQSCGITASSSWNSLFVNPVNPPVGSGYSTTGYRVRVVNNCTNPPTTSYLLLTPPTTVFNLRNNAFAPLVPLSPNCTYTISVQLQLNGVWQTNAGGQDLYGSSCVITTSPTYQRTIDSHGDETDFKVVAYPNPFNDEFNLDISTLSEYGLQIKIYDMMGRTIESHQATVSDLSSVTYGKNYASGVYNIIVSQGENVKTLRVIKR